MFAMKYYSIIIAQIYIKYYKKYLYTMIFYTSSTLLLITAMFYYII